MNSKSIAFVFSNQIYHVRSENEKLTVTKADGSLCFCSTIEAISLNQDPLSKLVIEIYQTLL